MFHLNLELSNIFLSFFLEVLSKEHRQVKDIHLCFQEQYLQLYTSDEDRLGSLRTSSLHYWTHQVLWSCFLWQMKHDSCKDEEWCLQQSSKMLLKLARNNFKYQEFHLKVFVIWAPFLKFFLNRALEYVHKEFHYSCLQFKRFRSFLSSLHLILTKQLFQVSLTNWKFSFQ